MTKEFGIFVVLASSLFLGGCGVSQTTVIETPKEPSVNTVEPSKGDEQTTVYKNPNGYQITYPASWERQTETDNTNENVVIRKNAAVQVPDGYGTPCPTDYLAISVRGPFSLAADGHVSFEQMVTARYDAVGSLGSFSGKKEAQTINGLHAYAFESGGVEGVCAGPAYAIELNSQSYLIVSVGLPAGDVNGLQSASQIVQSLKKTE
ncbi:hypothetical protein KBD18_00760 [Patescibacteria group bacterium]|nr:hypothetical protein [Patescibacteria group bacterium]